MELKDAIPDFGTEQYPDGNVLQNISSGHCSVLSNMRAYDKHQCVFENLYEEANRY
jgi:hypothetical protein